MRLTTIIASRLKAKQDFVFCGDFNAPRGGEIFSMLSSKYRDNIPKEVTTTLDRNLHRNGEDEGFPEIVVDGLFSAGSHQAHDTRVVRGVSDHCAVISFLSQESK